MLRLEVERLAPAEREEELRAVQQRDAKFPPHANDLREEEVRGGRTRPTVRERVRGSTGDEGESVVRAPAKRLALAAKQSLAFLLALGELRLELEHLRAQQPFLKLDALDGVPVPVERLSSGVRLGLHLAKPRLETLELALQRRLLELHRGVRRALSHRGRGRVRRAR